MLDEARLSYMKIVASNQLDEFVIKSLMEQCAPIDIFGIGTRLVTGHVILHWTLYINYQWPEINQSLKYLRPYKK